MILVQVCKFWYVLHRGVHDPDFRLKGALGDRFEPDQKHVVKVHEPLANFPLFVGESVYGL